MTILERVAEQTDRDALDHELARALSSVSDALALALTERPSGTLAVLVMNDQISDYDTAETRAFEVVADFERAHPDAVLDLVVLPLGEIDSFAVSESARLFDFRASGSAS